MNTKIILKFSCLALAFVGSSSAFADASADLLQERPVYRYSVFTNPAAAMNAFPLIGGSGMHLGGEYALSAHRFLNMNASYTKLNLSRLNNWVEQQKEPSENQDAAEDEKNITFIKSEVAFVNAGLRHFFRPSINTWFLGAFARYQRERSSFKYDDAQSTYIRTVAGPVVHGGHRWIWRHGGFFDLSGGLFAAVYEKKTYSWDSDDKEKTAAGERKIDNTKIPGISRYVTPEVAIAMGYLFQ